MKKTFLNRFKFCKDVACNVFTILIISFISESTIAQINQNVVRLDEISEKWLEGNREETLDLLLAKEKAGDTELVTIYNIGYLYFLKGDINKALSYFQRVVEEDDDYIYAYLQMARIREQMGLIHTAYLDLERALDEEDDNLELILEMARVTGMSNREQESVKWYRRAIDIHDDNIPALVGLASIYRQNGKLEEARNLLEGNTGIYDEAPVLHEKAKLYRALGKGKESRKFLTQIILDYPNSETWAHIRDTLRIKYNMTELPALDPLPSYSYQIDPKEELHYKVTYGPMTLGWMKVKILEPEFIGDKMVYPVIFFVDTNPSYGFILSLHHIYESYIDPVTLNSYKTRLYTPGSETYLVKTYYYDYDNNIFEAYQMTEDGRINYINKDLPRKVQDSTSMLYFARGLVSDKIGGMTVVVIDEEYKYGHITFLNETDPFTLEEKEIQSIKIFARAEFKGIAGMNGDAWGWFTPDEKAMPLKGDISIIVGSISIAVDEEKTEVPNFHEED
jgi:tetratricopeptide (TPR) repeat protein